MTGEQWMWRLTRISNVQLCLLLRSSGDNIAMIHHVSNRQMMNHSNRGYGFWVYEVLRIVMALTRQRILLDCTEYSLRCNHHLAKSS